MLIISDGWLRKNRSRENCYENMNSHYKLRNKLSAIYNFSSHKTIDADIQSSHALYQIAISSSENNKIKTTGVKRTLTECKH